MTAPAPPTATIADLLHATEEIAPGCTLSLINPLIYANAGAVADASYRRFLFWINAARDVAHPPLRLGRYAPDTVIVGDGPFHILAGNTLVAEHLVPAYAPLAQNHAHLIAARAHAIEVPAPAVFACHPGVNVWSHWLIDTLPRILLAEQAYPGRFVFAVPAALADPASPRFLVRSILESLAAYGIAPHRLLRLQPGTAYRFGALFDIAGLYADGVHPALLATLRRLQAPEPARPHPLLATIRAPGELRAVINHAEVIQTLAAAGATFQDPGATPFLSKVAAISAAETIAADLGSNLATCVYAQPGTAVLTLAPADWRDNYFANLFQRLDVRHADVRGVPLIRPNDAPGHHAHIVPVHHVLEALAACRAPLPSAGPLVVDGRPIARAPGPVLFRIDFGAVGKAPRFRKGTFSAPEGAHAWSEGPECGLAVPRRALGAPAPLWLEIKGIGFVARPHLVSRPLAILVNDHPLAEFDIEELTHLHVFIPIGAQAGRTLNIVFRHPVCPSPCSLGVSSDARPLGFMFEFVALRQVAAP